jgi:hypothetical protein
MPTAKVRPGELVAGACGVLLLVVTFLPWYEIGGNVQGAVGRELRLLAASRGLDLSRNAWQAFSVLDIVLFVTAMAAVGLLALAVAQRSVALPVAISVLVALLGAVAAVLVLIRLIDPPGLTLSSGVPVSSTAVGVRAWAYVGLALCGGIALGGFLAMADEGTDLIDASAVREATPVRPVPAAVGEPGGPPPERYERR